VCETLVAPIAEGGGLVRSIAFIVKVGNQVSRWFSGKVASIVSFSPPFATTIPYSVQRSLSSPTIRKYYMKYSIKASEIEAEAFRPSICTSHFSA
jgi:hypothetical protein